MPLSGPGSTISSIMALGRPVAIRSVSSRGRRRRERPQDRHLRRRPEYSPRHRRHGRPRRERRSAIDTLGSRRSDEAAIGPRQRSHGPGTDARSSARGAAAFGVKLHTGYVVALDGRDDAVSAVFDLGEDVGLIPRPRSAGVHEIERRSPGRDIGQDAAFQRLSFAPTGVSSSVQPICGTLSGVPVSVTFGIRSTMPSKDPIPA